MLKEVFLPLDKFNFSLIINKIMETSLNNNKNGQNESKDVRDI
jgi:hypothetical protein